jgi:EGF-like domain
MTTIFLAPNQDTEGCKDDFECQLTETCRNRICVNPCTNGSPCAQSAECLAQHHKAVCSCPSNMVGNPFIRCYQQEPVQKVECSSDSECTIDKACINSRCQNPCTVENPCSGNAECRVSYHRPLCACPIGWGGDPQTQCYKRKILRKF